MQNRGIYSSSSSYDLSFESYSPRHRRGTINWTGAIPCITMDYPNSYYWRSESRKLIYYVESWDILHLILLQPFLCKLSLMPQEGALSERDCRNRLLSPSFSTFHVEVWQSEKEYWRPFLVFNRIQASHCVVYYTNTKYATVGTPINYRFTFLSMEYVWYGTSPSFFFIRGTVWEGST